MFLHIREVGFCVTTVGLGDLYPYQLQDVDDNNNLMKKTLGLCLYNYEWRSVLKTLAFTRKTPTNACTGLNFP